MNRDRRLHLIAWIGSILFHCGLLSWGAYLLMKPATFTVKAGETSTEIELSMTSSRPQPVMPSTPPLSQPPSPLVPSPRPPPVTTAAAPDALSVPATPTVSTTPVFVPVAQHTPSPPLVKPQPAAKTIAKCSNAPKGATKAVPDEIHNDPPEYPDESRAAGEQGVVFLQVEVSATGTALSVHILKSSGYFRLDQAARQAVERWRFHPGMTAGNSVSSEADVPVRFTLQ